MFQELAFSNEKTENDSNEAYTLVGETGEHYKTISNIEKNKAGEKKKCQC